MVFFLPRCPAIGMSCASRSTAGRHFVSSTSCSMLCASPSFVPGGLYCRYSNPFRWKNLSPAAALGVPSAMVRARCRLSSPSWSARNSPAVMSSALHGCISLALSCRYCRQFSRICDQVMIGLGGPAGEKRELSKLDK